MSSQFINSIKLIEELLGEKFSVNENIYSINLKNSKTKTDIHIEVQMEQDEKFLVSVYTNNCHLQLQNCANIIVSNMLEEFIFTSETEDTISGMIISKQGDCALYSNVKKSVLSSDFSELNSEKLLSAVALSITESAG
ncbi:MAG: hypothetical protein K1X86_05500 [Ignavibacteria bacterium]|nr:hypothetical protein [Ignavibacteria bacterium]